MLYCALLLLPGIIDKYWSEEGKREHKQAVVAAAIYDYAIEGGVFGVFRQQDVGYV
jgi:hypothetical protein